MIRFSRCHLHRQMHFASLLHNRGEWRSLILCLIIETFAENVRQSDGFWETSTTLFNDNDTCANFMREHKLAKHLKIWAISLTKVICVLSHTHTQLWKLHKMIATHVFFFCHSYYQRWNVSALLHYKRHTMLSEKYANLSLYLTDIFRSHTCTHTPNLRCVSGGGHCHLLHVWHFTAAHRVHISNFKLQRSEFVYFN